MSNMNINGQIDKSQSLGIESGLIALDSQMAASGYDVDHPWRLALADVIAETIDTARLSGNSHTKRYHSIREHAHDVEIRAGNMVVLVEAITDQLDRMDCATPALQKISSAIECFTSSAMDNCRLVQAANEGIVGLANGGVQ